MTPKPRRVTNTTRSEPTEEEEYAVLQCPACERDVKVSSASAGKRMGCPYCRTPLEITEAEPDDQPQDDEKKPRVRLPLVFRELRDDDVGVDPNLEFADEFGRRRLPFEAPEWDDEVKSPGDGSEKRPLTRKEHNFRAVKAIILSVGIATAAAIAYLAFVHTIGVARQDKKTVQELPEEVRKKIAEAIARGDQENPGFLTSAEEDAAVAIVRGFLQAKSIEERLPFVRDPERVEPIMRDYYSRSGSEQEWPEGKVLLRAKSEDQDRYFIRLAIDFGSIGSRFFAVEQTEDSLRLDWETAVGYQQMPLAEFKQKRPTAPVEFRAKLKPSSYYNFEFRDPDLYYAVEMTYPGRPDFKLFGYIDRTRDWAPALIERLEKNEAPSAIVAVQYPTGQLQRELQVEIISLISETWWL